jgi:lysophospholipase L1-like esterase
LWLGALVNWLALGDSYTIGEGVSPAERWPMQVAARLRAQDLAVDDPVVVARTGWTAEELLRGMEAALWPARERFDVVTLLIGVNDQYRGRAIAEFAPAFAECLERAVTLARGDAARVVVVSIPDWGVTPFADGRDREAIAVAIDAYNRHVLGAAARRGAGTCDITPLSRSGDPAAAALAHDGLHPCPRAYAAWAGVVAPVVAEAIRRPRIDAG